MGNPLKAYREQESLSQQDIAERIGISRQMVGFLENGERDFTAEMALRIEDALGINRVLMRPDLFRKREARAA